MEMRDMRTCKVRETEEVRCDKYVDGTWFSYTWSEVYILGVWYGIFEDADGNEIYAN